MDKNAIKKFAVWARRELISRVSQKAYQYGITEDSIVPGDAASVNGLVLSADEIRQRKALIDQINAKDYQQVMEEVAYTWFNRFIALRFMEVNNYLPSRVRVFTDADNRFKPQILTEAIDLELDGLDIDRVFALKDANDDEALFKYLLITQCNALSAVLPGMFQRICDYTELLFPDNLLRDGSVVEQMIAMIPQEDWTDQVQIIGWLYQYYNSEKKDAVFAALKKNVKITKENIPAATQLFTPDWIVRYMVENSLGRLWVEGHPDEELKSEWKYYLEEAEQEPAVQKQLAEIRREYAAMTPEDIRCIDPCMGSGHILAYLFDVLMQIYQTSGYGKQEAVRLIIERNLYGLDIDDRAAQLAYFTVMMKARQYDRRFLARKNADGEPDVPQPHVLPICESNGIDRSALADFIDGDAERKKAMDSILKEMTDAREYGSILNITPVDFDALYTRFDEIHDEFSLSRDTILTTILPLVRVAQMLSQKYDVVVTNPPYMGASGMGAKLSVFVKKYYPDTKSDMSTVCMEKTLTMCKPNGFMAMINIPVWMFISSYEKLRNHILHKNTITSMVHPGRGIFGSDFGTTVFVINKHHVDGYRGTYRRLFDKQGEVEGIEVREQAFLSGKGHFVAEQSNFFKIPGAPVAYWVSMNMIGAFSNKLLADYATSNGQNITGDNNKFLRLFWEIDHNKISNDYWAKCARGGGYRKYHGNDDTVILWTPTAREHYRRDNIARIVPDFLRFRDGITWSYITSSIPSFRKLWSYELFEKAGTSIFINNLDYLNPLLGLLNSVVAREMLGLINPTINYQVRDVFSIPVAPCVLTNSDIAHLVEKNIVITQEDWDAYETSWDFLHHPLLPRKEKGIEILAGMKVGKEKWIKRLRDGSVCFSPVEDFIWQGEHTGNNEQGDKYEGVFARLLHDDPRISEMASKFGDDLETIIDGDYTLLRRKSCRNVPVLCVYGFFKEDAEVISHKDIGSGNVLLRLRLTPSLKMFGDFLNRGDGISNEETWGMGFSLGHFQQNVERALDDQGIRYRPVKVKYDLFDSDEFFVEPGDGYTELEHKRKQLDYQREIRWILPDMHRDDKYVIPYTPLDVGSVGVNSFNNGIYCDFNVVGHLRNNLLISDCFENWRVECETRFQQLKANEEELNRIFIDIYGLQDELTPEVEDKDVTVRKADLGRDIRSLISYAVGCMFGRYSLDCEGLAYAGGEWDNSKYPTFPAAADNIIPICDDDYFADDLVGRFVRFIETVYGSATLEENLRFIADALGGKGQPREVIRNYLLNDFYADHLKIYQKRPIYWLFDSGKKGGFKALIYMHRYAPDTIARLRTDYVHEQQSRYRTAIADLEQRIPGVSTSERVKLSKKLKKLQEQSTELQTYEEKIHHLADQFISIDLDDGVKKNYEIFKDVLAKIK